MRAIQAADEAEIIRMRRAGATLASIAERFGVAMTTASTFLRRRGLEMDLRRCRKGERERMGRDVDATGVAVATESR